MKNCNCPELTEFCDILITLIMESIIKDKVEFVE